MYPPKLSIKNLTKTYSSKNHSIEALSSISMHINPGEFVSIIGSSGCGKSTLCNIIAGLEEPTSGSIAIDREQNKTRLGTSGYMLQNPLLLPWKTVEENVMLGLRVQHVSEKNARIQARELLQEFQLLAFAGHYPSVLSGGMAQRVALLRTILFNKLFLLMDEPFGALDALTRLSMQTWLLDVWQKCKSSVLFVTHDIREAIFLSDRIYVFSHRPGTIIKEIPVSLPRPRRREFLSEKHTGALEKELEGILLGEL